VTAASLPTRTRPQNTATAARCPSRRRCGSRPRVHMDMRGRRNCRTRLER
jgi:hypothetical protein